MSFLIRAYAHGDLPALQAVRAAAFAPVFASFRAIVGPEIAALGLTTAEQEQADLLDAIASPDSGHAIATLKAAGMQLATVGTGGDPSHAPARRAYEKAGFNVHLPSIYMYRKL
jgi:hypothetical protein